MSAGSRSDFGTNAAYQRLSLVSPAFSDVKMARVAGLRSTYGGSGRKARRSRKRGNEKGPDPEA